MTDENIIVGIQGDVEGGRVIKRVLDDIVVSENKVQKASKDLQNQLSATDTAAKFLKNTMQGLGVAFGVRQLQQTVDVYTNIQNRLKLVTGSSEELAGVTDELFRISNDTRNAFESTAETYARVALATKDMGLSQRDTLNFTESLNQAVVLSGASAAEASAGLMQLSQGLASGTLRGDELRSVLEQLPMVADVIADGLGVTRGELRKMGEEGKITADQVIAAFSLASDELRDKFGQTVPTIGQSFVVLRNNFIQFIGELDKSTGVSGEIAKLIITIADNIGTLAEALAGAAVAWGIFKAAVVLSSVELGVVIAALTGPGALIAALGAAGVASFVFRDELTSGVIWALTEIVILADKANDAFGKLFNTDRFSLTKKSAEELRAGAQDMILDMVDKNDPLKKSGTVSNKRGANVTGSAGNLDARKDAQKELKQLIKETSSEQETLHRKLVELEKLKPYAKTKEELEAINRAQQLYNEKLKTASDTVPGMNDAMDRLIKQTDKFAESTASAFKDFVTGAKNGKEALADLVGALYQMVIQETITSPLSGILRGILGGGGSGANNWLSGIGSSISSAAGSLFGSIRNVFGFDSGGSMILGGKNGIDQNTLSLNGAPIANVGRGEVLSISPNQSGGAGGGSIVVNQVFQITAGVAASVAAEFQAYLPKIQESTMAAVKEAQLRGIT